MPTAPKQLPEPASDLLEFGMIIQRLATHLASSEVLSTLQQAVEQQDAQRVQELARDAAILGEVRLDEQGRVVLRIRLGPVDGMVGMHIPSR